MAEEPVQLPKGQPALRVMPMPADVNQNGDVFGGWIMAQVDVAGAIPAMRRARGRVATVSVNSFLFKQPVSVGDVVSFYAEIVETGRTSIKVNVEVYAERNPTRHSLFLAILGQLRGPTVVHAEDRRDARHLFVTFTD